MTTAETVDDDEFETPQETAIWDRHNRAVANILGIKDRIEGLSENDHRRLRGVVLREFGEFAEMACQLLRASAGGLVINEVYVKMLSDIHDAVVQKT